MLNSLPDKSPEIKLIEFLGFAIHRLKTAGIGGADLDARLLTAHGLKLDRAQLLSQSERLLTLKEISLLTVFIECRARHESVARIKGSREFWGLPFGLNEATLEPRPDSETLIEATLKRISNRQKSYRILDLGTGTGCLLLSLLQEFPYATGLGVDISSRAIEQAQINADKLNFKSRATFLVNNWLEHIDETFDIIISNPPYIAQKEIQTLMPEVLNFDPPLALDGGMDGYDPYRLLIPELPKRLQLSGLIVFEVGQGQAKIVSYLMKSAGFKNIQTHTDLSGINRCLTAFIA